MNLYLVLAIAFGAISGVVETPLLQPARLVARRDRHDRRPIRASRRVVIARSAALAPVFRPTTHVLRPIVSGNTAPRAPAVV
jgi:hypothetical protein